MMKIKNNNNNDNSGNCNQLIIIQSSIVSSFHNTFATAFACNFSACSQSHFFRDFFFSLFSAFQSYFFSVFAWIVWVSFNRKFTFVGPFFRLFWSSQFCCCCCCQFSMNTKTLRLTLFLVYKTSICLSTDGFVVVSFSAEYFGKCNKKPN